MNSLPLDNSASSILSDTEALELAQHILVQGPTGNPRAVLQAYNTFQARWRIIRARGLEADARLLAVMLLLQYAWPELFSQVFGYPELFFFLHALITGQANSVCSAPEIDELNDLGAPLSASDSPINQWRQPGLARLLAALPSESLETKSSAKAAQVDRLMMYMTLAQSTAPTGIHLVDTWTALTSGDPVLIRFALRVGRMPELQLPLLLESVVDLTLNLRPEESTMVHKAIFGLGRIRDNRVTSTLANILEKPEQLPPAILRRTVYALTHHASDREYQWNGSARSAIVKLLGNAKLDDTARMCVVKLICHWDNVGDDQWSGLFNLLSPVWPATVSLPLKLASKRALLQRPIQSLRLVELGNIDPEFVCELCDSKTDSWPPAIGRYLVRLSLNRGTISDRAYRLIGSYADKKQALLWLALIALANPGRNSDCLKKIGQRQALMDEWQGPVWRRLTAHAIASNSDDIQESLVASLPSMFPDPVCNILREMQKNVVSIRLQELVHDKLDENCKTADDGRASQR